MKTTKIILAIIGFVFLAFVLIKCQKDDSFTEDQVTLDKTDPRTEANNLSFPVIWSDGYELELREPPDGQAYSLKGQWSYVWGKSLTDNYCCKPHPLDSLLCEDKTTPGDGVSTLYKSYIQQVKDNVWKADNFKATSPVAVDLIDWSDNLETADWNTRSLLNIEILLYEQLEEQMKEFAMRHLTGWGGGDICGFQCNLDGEPVYGPGTVSTVYSHNARFTIQKINVNPSNIEPEDIMWVPGEGWRNSISLKNVKIFNDPIFNMPVYRSGDGPAYFNGEVNVEGRLSYGYLWHVQSLNSGKGFYRLTFSFDKNGIVPLNTFFDENTTIIDPLKPAPSVGGTPIIDVKNNLSYIDIRIFEKNIIDDSK